MEVNILNKTDVLNTLGKGRKVEGRLWMELKEDGKYEIFFGKYNRSGLSAILRLRLLILCYDVTQL